MNREKLKEFLTILNENVDYLCVLDGWKQSNKQHLDKLIDEIFDLPDANPMFAKAIDEILFKVDKMQKMLDGIVSEVENK